MRATFKKEVSSDKVSRGRTSIDKSAEERETAAFAFFFLVSFFFLRPQRLQTAWFGNVLGKKRAGM